MKNELDAYRYLIFVLAESFVKLHFPSLSSVKCLHIVVCPGFISYTVSKQLMQQNFFLHFVYYRQLQGEVRPTVCHVHSDYCNTRAALVQLE